MLHRLFSTIIAVVCCMAASAQGTCVIKGAIGEGGKSIKSVALVRTNDLGQEIEVAKAKVKKGKYTFEQELAKDEPVLMYAIKGLSQDLEVFVEQGEVTVNTPSAAKPWESSITGTPTNDTYTEFKGIVQSGGTMLLDSKGSQEDIKRLSQAVRFLIDHNASPMTPLMIERYLLQMLTPAYAEQMLNSVAFQMQNHPYTVSLRNKVLAGSLKVGNELPDIQLPMLDGVTKHLSDFRGKYVVLNFWANGDAKSEQVIEELQGLYDIVKDSLDQIVLVSYALENDIAAWKAAVGSNGMEHEGWLNACDGAGTDSPAAKLLGVEKAPRIIIIEPEGRAVTMDMDVDELIIRIEQILSGDLYYLDQQKD